MNQNQELQGVVESYILGAMMQEPSLVPTATRKIDSLAFSSISHQLIYDAIFQSYEEHAKTDPIIVADLLQKTDQIKRIGGPVYLYDLNQSVVETSNFEYYLEILHETWLRKKISSIGDSMKVMSEDQETAVDSLMDDLQAQIFNLNMDTGLDDRTLISENLSDVLQNILNPHEGQGVRSGFYELDTLTNGFENGDLIIFAARPSMGKSALAANIIHNVAIDQQKPALIFSLEMPKSQIIMRLLSTETRIPYTDLRRGRVDEDQWELIIQAMTRLKYAPIHIVDRRGLKVSTIKSEARKIKMENPDLGLIVVDYVQLVYPSKVCGTREQEVSEVVRNLKNLAGELEVPVLICSQVNRQHERADDKRPAMSSLRESGELEQTADLICFLYREDYYDDDSVEEEMITECNLLIRKNRNGPTGEISLNFNKEIITFESIFDD